MAIVDLARTAGTSKASIRQMEAGSARSPGLLLGIRLADALGVDPQYLALGEDAAATRLDDFERRLRTVEKRVAELVARGGGRRS